MGDRLAAFEAASRLGLDADAEDLAIVLCGSKSAIPFFARVCTALDIPFLVLHDEDIYPVDGDDVQRASIEAENQIAETKNEEIMKATNNVTRIFVVRPSLEAALGIGRSARDKPQRVLEALQASPPDDFPFPLRGAVEALFAERQEQDSVEVGRPTRDRED